MDNLLNLVQIILGVSTIVLVMLQPPNDEIAGSISAVQVSKRGWEKVTFTFTLSVCGLFVLFSLFHILSPGIRP
jgi:preprotein translocase subunit SecG